MPSQAKVVFNKDKNRTYTVTYVPKVEGVHMVNTTTQLMFMCLYNDSKTMIEVAFG